MSNVAKDMMKAEMELGIMSIAVDPNNVEGHEFVFDADVHVSHSHVPVMTKDGKSLKSCLTKPFKLVGVFHGTPEHIFRGSVWAGEGGAYAPSNSLMIMQHDMKRSDALVTFWPRHADIMRTMLPTRDTRLHLIPMGLDHEFWKAGKSRGKFAGAPSVWTGENAHDIKWPFDLLTMWPWVSGTHPLETVDAAEGAVLHCAYLPHDQHRWWFPWVHANGAFYRAYIGPWTYPHEELRNVLNSVDFVCGLVEKGDFNRIQLESILCGAKSISYAGNPYAHFWLPEGDQRITARALANVLNGKVEPRDPTPPPTLSDMAHAMKGIYESIL